MIAPAPGLSFSADQLAVDRILGNLVGNAIAAFGSEPSGLDGGTMPAAPHRAERRAATEASPATRHIWLAVRRVSGPPAGDGVSLEVTDDGPGFPPGTTARVFERFFRADPARARAGGGSGLGLAIVRELPRAHGGEAYAENVAPHGGRVSVVLPLVSVPGRAG